MEKAMNTISRLLIAVLLVGCTRAASAQTADEVVEKYLAAIGGREALAKLTSRSMAGTITVATPGGEVSGPIEVVNQAPNKARMLVKLDLTSLGAGQMIIDQRFNGTVGYVIDTLQGNRDITGGQLEAMKNAAFPTPLLHYKENGATVELAGTENVGDREAHVLVLKPKSGPAVRQFIDAESFLLLKNAVKLDSPQFGEIEQTTEFSDYRPVGDVKVPFAVKTSSAVQNTSIAVTKIEHNTTIDEALFSKPQPDKER
jgi:outer membrane lipoprotein-sorting protein